MRKHLEAIAAVQQPEFDSATADAARQEQFTLDDRDGLSRDVSVAVMRAINPRLQRPLTGFMNLICHSTESHRCAHAQRQRDHHHHKTTQHQPALPRVRSHNLRA